MAVPNRVFVLRLHRDFEEPNVYIAILEAFQKLGYDRPTHLLCSGGTRYFHHATDEEWQVIALAMLLYPTFSTVLRRSVVLALAVCFMAGSSLPKHDCLQGPTKDSSVRCKNHEPL